MDTITRNKNNRIKLHKLAVAISAQVLLASHVSAAPAGGSVVGGTGDISQSGSHTQITQESGRLAIDWDTFDVGTDESVRFVQPSADATALNRILDVDASQILGRIDANGRIILMNPNGLTFGEDSVVNVQSLVASGLNIDSDAFMDGELSFEGIAGAAGVVVSSGIINAATGGNVALLGKRVENRGLISARLGRVALAAGNEAVLTFDEAGLLGVRIDEATLGGDMDGDTAVINRGQVTAQGGRILLNASVSEDLFSAAVNHGQLAEGVDAVVHSDGSFTLGSARGVVNQGSLNVSADSGSAQNAGQVLMAGRRVVHQGVANASTSGNGLAGDIRMQATDAVILGPDSDLMAEASAGTSGHIHLQSAVVRANGDADLDTTGNATVVGSQHVRLPEIEAHHLRIHSGGEVRQLGSLTVDGHTHVSTTSDKAVRLDNSNNDFGSVSLDGQQGSRISVVEQNDVALGDITLERGSMTLTSTGEGAEISQRANSTIAVNNGSLSMVADNLVLGGNGSRTQVTGGQLQLEFRDSVDTNGSITLAGSTPSSAARILSYGGGTVAISLQGQEQIDLVAQIERDVHDHYLEINVGRMLGESALFAGPSTEVLQTGPITLSDTLTWNGDRADLMHAENDVRSVTRHGKYLSPFGILNFFDKNDLEIGVFDDDAAEDMVDISAGGDIRQAPHTSISVGQLALSADRMFLGAGGTSGVHAYYSIGLEFQSELWLDGYISTGLEYGGGLSITGSGENNLLVFGENISDLDFDTGFYDPLIIDLFDGNDHVYVYGGNIWFSDEEPEPGLQGSRFDLGPGDDELHLYGKVHAGIRLGDGRDVVTVNRPELSFSLTDFDSVEDVMIQTYP